MYSCMREGTGACHPERMRVDIYLQTERLRLRWFTLADLPLLVDLDGDPEVMRYLTGGIPTPPDRIRDVVLPRYLESYRNNPNYGHFAAETRDDGVFIGWFHLRPPHHPYVASPPATLEVGYRLRRAAWGQGLATEGARALVAHSFLSLGASRVIAYTMAVNLASRRVMEKVGLHFLRSIHPARSPEVPGSDRGEVEYGIEREDWERQYRDRRVRRRGDTK